MATLILITITFVLLCAGIAWLITGVGRVADDMMDKIINHDRHEYKDAERGSNE